MDMLFLALSSDLVNYVVSDFLYTLNIHVSKLFETIQLDVIDRFSFVCRHEIDRSSCTLGLDSVLARLEGIFCYWEDGLIWADVLARKVTILR